MKIKWPKTKTTQDRMKRPYKIWLLSILLLLSSIAMLILFNLPEDDRPQKPTPVTQTVTSTTTTVPGSIIVVGPGGDRITVLPGQPIPEGSKTLAGVPIPNGSVVAPTTTTPQGGSGNGGGGSIPTTRPTTPATRPTTPTTTPRPGSTTTTRPPLVQINPPSITVPALPAVPLINTPSDTTTTTSPDGEDCVVGLLGSICI